MLILVCVDPSLASCSRQLHLRLPSLRGTPAGRRLEHKEEQEEHKHKEQLDLAEPKEQLHLNKLARRRRQRELLQQRPRRRR